MQASGAAMLEGAGRRRSAQQVAREIGARVAAAPTNVADWFEALVRRYTERPAMIFEDRSWTYGEIDRHANRIAHAAIRQGIGAGDSVALALSNSVDLLSAILAMAKIDASCSLIDPRLPGEALRHALGSIPVGLVIADEADETVRAYHAASGVPFKVRAGAENLLADWIAHAPIDPPPREARAAIAPSAPIFHIFTSGTTGLPKAAACSHARYVSSGMSEAVLLGLTERDRMYVVLPMYHIAALSAIAAAFSVGASVLLRARFSVTNFWPDVRTHGVTAMQYLGEIARYVASRPATAADRDHGLRTMIGAGMQAQVWRAFRDRFGVPHIVECYGSSEGVCSLVNLDGVVGSVGRPAFGDTSMRIVRLDDAHGLLRSEDGGFVDCATDEPGELIGALSASNVFEGYSSESATQARLAREYPADANPWFRTGDLFRRDAEGYFHFLDRLGDTYRWKGENIATQQVAAALESEPDIARAVVYGVRVPGIEGRAGMALIEPAEDYAIEMTTLAARLGRRLAPAAVPVFIRTGTIEALTGTYKVRVAELRAQGYDASAGVDPLYVLDAAAAAYVPLDETALSRNGVAPYED
ncbi:fatty-acyl-CoA synthase [Sphingobium sp. OAS761]|uniref:AMP-binding protein n=1 Tax=Sphingobium sp. OAS761 TaxID=2817901 RepID=UPI00209E4619|nr:AMP-binding protein [Sphingobium sp. OAS761]MCP1471479.1 fatty-acyl-CoA synthase [Sphingobium sp. OAS761]